MGAGSTGGVAFRSPFGLSEARKHRGTALLSGGGLGRVLSTCLPANSAVVNQRDRGLSVDCEKKESRTFRPRSVPPVYAQAALCRRNCRDSAERTAHPRKLDRPRRADARLTRPEAVRSGGSNWKSGTASRESGGRVPRRWSRSQRLSRWDRLGAAVGRPWECRPAERE